MGSLRPIGSEKLQGMDKIKRIIEISRYNEHIPNPVNEIESKEYSRSLADGNRYEIVKERLGYIIKNQISEGLFHLTPKDMESIVVAYEPVWAIGTGLTASSDQAEEVHAYIRSLISEKFGEPIADNTSILYGGSVKPDNAVELFSRTNIDGGLIGGAALKARDFFDIIKAIK